MTLTVTDDRAQTGTSERILSITSPSQVSAEMLVTGKFLTGRELSFDAGGSSSSGGSIASYEWDFGDTTTAVGSQAAHVYENPGEYTILLRVTDAGGAQAEVRKIITIAYEPNGNPVLEQMTCPAQGPTGEAVSFSASATDPNEDDLTYSWDFGDGASAEGA